MKVTVYTLNAFAKTENGGNPAGVVLDAHALSDGEMQRIAAKVGFSETAFVCRSDTADRKLRFFTPAAEVDLCGHATIAAFSLLARKQILRLGRYTQETKAGLLPVEIGDDGVIFMDQNNPVFYETVDARELADSLNIPEDCLMPGVPAQIVSTGLRDILIPVGTLSQLLGIRPDFDKIKAVSKKYDVIGYHLFTLESLHSATAHCRNLAPLYDIPEEAATGTSSGALGCYLYEHGLIPEKSVSHLVFEQGYAMNRPSEIFVQVALEKGRVSGVRVGGFARDIREIEVEA